MKEWGKKIRCRRNLLEFIESLFNEKDEYSAKEILNRAKTTGKLSMKLSSQSIGGILRGESNYIGETKYSKYCGYTVTVWRRKNGKNKRSSSR